MSTINEIYAAAISDSDELLRGLGLLPGELEAAMQVAEYICPAIAQVMRPFYTHIRRGKCMLVVQAALAISMKMAAAVEELHEKPSLQPSEREIQSDERQNGGVRDEWWE